MDPKTDTKYTKKVKCGRCKYSWVTRSKRRFTNCPNCMAMVKVRNWEEFRKLRGIK